MANPAPGWQKYPDHKVDIAPFAGQVEISHRGHPVAASKRALCLQESRYEPAYYLPLEDVDQSLLVASQNQTYCPFKGHASYWHLRADAELLEDALWGYADPYDECLPLKGHVAFYPDKVNIQIQDQAD